MIIYFWGFLGGLAAVVFETWVRLHPGSSYRSMVWLGIPLALVINWSVYHLMRTGETLIGAIVVFTLATATWRVLSTLLVLGESPSRTTWFAYGLIVLAGLLRHGRGAP